MPTKLDRFAQEQVPLLLSNSGNAALNMKYEAVVPKNVNKLNSKHPTSKCDGIKQALCELFCRKEPEKIPAESYSSGSLQINRVRGMNLTTRNLAIGNPYLILSLGHQTTKTKAIKGSSDPVWNEGLIVDIPDCILPLKLEVRNKDAFAWNDKMGDAVIDIRPLVLAREWFKKEMQESGASEGNGEERRLLAIFPEAADNQFCRDSKMWLVQGRVRQEMMIMLKNIQMGDLEIELEYLPPVQ